MKHRSDGSDGFDSGLPWQRLPAGAPSRLGKDPLPREWLIRPVPELARALLGVRLHSAVGGEEVTGVVVETEAYLGPEDPASHAATRSGVTARNRLMFGPAGPAYIYRSYGVHWCLNVVGGVEGEIGAVLIRGAELLEGGEVVRRRRGRASDPANGPGRLTQAFGIDGSLNGHELTAPPLRLLPGWEIPEARVRTTGRIGVRSAERRPLRYIVADSPGVSPARPHPGDPLSSS